MYCYHQMPFGAALVAEQGVDFRLWAPAATNVAVELAEGDVSVAMQPGEEGWYRCTTDRARAGSLYKFRINDAHLVPDPASRFQPNDVHSWSQVIDARQWRWEDSNWQGRPWEDVVIYELHIGTFTPQGTFAALISRLDYLVGLGITAIELMPIADFPGRWNWGYDGVLAFAPDSQYGTPDELKALVQAAHSKGLMVFLDVVYNHFGPEGNYLGLYAPQFFTEKHHTPWGAALNFDDQKNRVVRDFFIHNALYWLSEYRFDGLRFDAVHAILDDSRPDILEELARCVQDVIPQRHVHLMLENDNNAAAYLRRDVNGKPQSYVAQWNDDIHHAMHVLISGEKHGYYIDYIDHPTQQLARSLAEGFAYQGDRSSYRGKPRGEPSTSLPPEAFISFLQNHDQVGNRALGERINALVQAEAVKAAMAIFLLAPNPPLLFMGQEWGSTQPFPFFCDFSPELAAKVTAGRRNEFAQFPQFSDEALRQRIPDPSAQSTFQSAVLKQPAEDDRLSQDWLAFYRSLLHLRHHHIVPLLATRSFRAAEYQEFAAQGLAVFWQFEKHQLMLLANLSDHYADDPPKAYQQRLYASTNPLQLTTNNQRRLPPWFVGWFYQAA